MFYNHLPIRLKIFMNKKWDFCLKFTAKIYLCELQLVISSKQYKYAYTVSLQILTGVNCWWVSAFILLLYICIS